MRKRWTVLRTYLISFVLVLALAGNASAAAKTWDGGAADINDWNAPTNWSGDSVPGSGDTVTIDVNTPPDNNCLIGPSMKAECTSLNVGKTKSPCILTMTDGNLTTSANITIGGYDNADVFYNDGNGLFRMSGGDVNIIGSGRLWIGYGAKGTPPPGSTPTYGTFIMTGGRLNILPVGDGKKLELGKNPSGVGVMDMNGGDVNIGDDFEFATYGTATLYMRGGTIYMDDNFRFGLGIGDGIDGGTASLYLSGGSISCDEIWLFNNRTTVDITGGGSLIVRTESTQPRVQGYVDEGWLTAYGGDGILDMVVAGGVLTITGRLPDPNLAWRPRPRNSATVVWTLAGPTVNWTRGQYAADANGHEVYFGNTFAEVNEANYNSAQFQAYRDVNNWDVSRLLNLGQTYYWRVDENNDVCDPCNWKGDVWNFKVANYTTVENFDSYDSNAALRAVWKVSGSSVEVNSTIAQDGNSMRYNYTNGSATEAEANVNPGGPNSLPVITKNWTQANIKAMAISFYGSGTNISQKMYVALRSGDGNLAVVYYDEPNDLNEPVWHEWNIDLADFSVAGPNNVNLSDVNKVYIGFGTRGSPTTRSGKVWFDDIRLYTTRCVAAFAPEGDFDGDCIVNFVDFNTMATDWLDTDVNRKGANATLKGDANFVDDDDRGWCVRLNGDDGDNDWIDLDSSDFFNFRNKTIVFWVKIRNYQETSRYIFYFSDGATTDPYRIYFLTHANLNLRVRFVGDYSKDFIAGKNNWCLLAFSIKDTDDGLCQGTFYAYNGNPLDSVRDVNDFVGYPRNSGSSEGVNLGSSDDGATGAINAVFDDFRVYDYALSWEEIEFIAGNSNGSGNPAVPPDDNLMLLHYTFDEGAGTTAANSSAYKYYHPVISDAELYDEEPQGQRAVNFRDFAILASNWRQNKQFP